MALRPRALHQWRHQPWDSLARPATTQPGAATAAPPPSSATAAGARTGSHLQGGRSTGETDPSSIAPRGRGTSCAPPPRTTERPVGDQNRRALSPRRGLNPGPILLRCQGSGLCRRTAGRPVAILAQAMAVGRQRLMTRRRPDGRGSQAPPEKPPAPSLTRQAVTPRGPHPTPGLGADTGARDEGVADEARTGGEHP